MQLVNIVQRLSESSSGEYIEVLPFNGSALGAVDIAGVSQIGERKL